MDSVQSCWRQGGEIDPRENICRFFRNSYCVCVCVGDDEDLSGGHRVSAADATSAWKSEKNYTYIRSEAFLVCDGIQGPAAILHFIVDLTLNVTLEMLLDVDPTVLTATVQLLVVFSGAGRQMTTPYPTGWSTDQSESPYW